MLRSPRDRVVAVTDTARGFMYRVDAGAITSPSPTFGAVARCVSMSALERFRRGP